MRKRLSCSSLAAFAFPPHPALLAFAPLTLAMKEKESSLSVPAVQLLDPSHHDFEVFRSSGM
jgi:hypothetical protein